MDFLKYPSLVVLIIANLVPLYGVYALGWSSAELMLLYWSESAIVGFYTLLKMALAKGTMSAIIAGMPYIPSSSEDVANVARLSANADVFVKAILMLFFMFHFGAFMLGHLLFIIAFFVRDFSPALLLPVLLGSASLFLSHGVSFVLNYLGGKEYLKSDARGLMVAPYNRIFIMHFAIIFGAFIQAPAVVLVGGKTLTDAYAHLKERERYQ